MRRSKRLQERESRSTKRRKEEPQTHIAFDAFNAVGEEILKHLPAAGGQSIMDSEAVGVTHVRTILALKQLGLVETAQIRSHMVHNCNFSMDEFLHEDKKTTVPQLKALCRVAKVSTSGTKAELLGRLQPTSVIPASLYGNVRAQIEKDRLNKIQRISKRGVIDDGRYPLWMEYILNSIVACDSLYKKHLVSKPFNLPSSIVDRIPCHTGVIHMQGYRGGWDQTVYNYRPSFVLYIASLVFNEDKMASIIEYINGMENVMNEIRAEDKMREQLENSFAKIREIWDKQGWSGLELLDKEVKIFKETFPYTYDLLIYMQGGGEESIARANLLMERAIASRTRVADLQSRHGITGVTEDWAQKVSDMVDRAITTQEMWVEKGFDDVDVLDITIVLHALKKDSKKAPPMHVSGECPTDGYERAAKLIDRYSLTWKYIRDGNGSLEGKDVEAKSLMERAIASRTRVADLQSRHGITGVTEDWAEKVSDMVDRAISTQEMWAEKGFDDVDVLDIATVLRALKRDSNAPPMHVSAECPTDGYERAAKLKGWYSLTWEYIRDGNGSLEHMQARTFVHQKQQCIDAESRKQMTERLAAVVIQAQSLLEMMRKEWKERDLPGDAFLTVENILQYLLDGPAFFKSLPECEDAWENGIPSKWCFLYRYFFYFNGIERKYLTEDRIRFHSERLKHVPHTSIVSSVQWSQIDRTKALDLVLLDSLPESDCHDVEQHFLHSNGHGVPIFSCPYCNYKSGRTKMEFHVRSGCKRYRRNDPLSVIPGFNTFWEKLQFGVVLD